MNADQLTELIKVVAYVAGAAFTTWKAIDKAGDILINRDKQRSVGEEAIRKISEQFLTIEGDIERLRNDSDQKERLIEKLDKDLEILMDRVWKFLSK